MLLSTILFNDLSLESQFVSLLTVSEEIIKATTASHSEDVVPHTTAELLHLFPELGCSHLAPACRTWTRSSLQSAAQSLALCNLKRGRRREGKRWRSTKSKPLLVVTPDLRWGNPLRWMWSSVQLNTLGSSEGQHSLDAVEIIKQL